MEIIDNINKSLKNDLEEEIHKESKVSIAAACFSIYAYQELKKGVKGCRRTAFYLYLSDFY